MERRTGVSQAELEVLRYVTEHHPATVRDATAHFAAGSGWARTTVQTLMERLCHKGYLSRRIVKGVSHYSPAAPRSELQIGLVRNFVQRALGGSVAPFMTYLGQEADLTDQELEELKRLVQTLEAQRKERQP